jgi:hypothetical protein
MGGGEHEDKVADLPSGFGSTSNHRKEGCSSSSSNGVSVIIRATSLNVSNPSEEEVSQHFSGLAGNHGLVVKSGEDPFIRKHDGTFLSQR